METKNARSVCPIEKTVEAVGDHCSMLIIRDLLTGAKRFSDLGRSLGAVSSRTLAKKLQSMAKDKFITRKKYKESPPRVEYALTKKGRDLNDVAKAMRAYGKKHL